MDTLLPLIREQFAAKREHLTVFAHSDCRLEGWFKGELLVLFSGLRQAGVIDNFQREVNIPSVVSGKRLQVDFRVQIGGAVHLFEVKTLCISQAAGTPRNLTFYFRDDHVGIIKDLRKLDAITATNKWLIAFVYPAPNRRAWDRAVSGLPQALRQWAPTNDPADICPQLYVSLWGCKAQPIA